MAVHDWTLVEAGIFRDFHTVWVSHIRSILNEGLLPEGYYALAQQHAGQSIADVLTLHTSTAAALPAAAPPMSGGTAVAEAPPRVRRRQTLDGSPAMRRRTVAIRHVIGHRLVALLEIVSPANNDCARHVAAFAEKAIAALEAGIHVLIVDLFPPGLHDPQSIHGVIAHQLSVKPELYDVPPGEPITLAGYVAGPIIDAYLEHAAIGAALPDMPLFLRPGYYVNVPLEQTYQMAFRGLPGFYRDVLEAKTPG